MDEEDKELVIKAVAKVIASWEEADSNRDLETLVEDREDVPWAVLKEDWTQEVKQDLEDRGETSPEAYKLARAQRWAEGFYRLRNDRERKGLREQVERIPEERILEEFDLGI